MPRPKKKKKGARKHNGHDPGAVALHFDDGTQRIYVVMNVEATIIAVFEEDRRGWGTLADAGYDCPVYGPIEVESQVIHRLMNVPKRERESVGQIMVGLIGKPLQPYFKEKTLSEPNPSPARHSVEVKQNGRSAPLTATLADRISQTKRKLLK